MITVKKKKFNREHRLQSKKPPQLSFSSKKQYPAKHNSTNRINRAARRKKLHGDFSQHEVTQPKEPEEHLHPSWEAKKKLKQQAVQISNFKGSKITFDD